jgi:hypothetical protein
MQREVSLTSGVPARMLLYGTSLALAIALFVPLHHRLWPVSFLAVAVAPVVDGVRGRSIPRRHARLPEPKGDLASELAALEGIGYVVLSEVTAGREVIPFVAVGPTGAFSLREISWPGQFSLRKDGWFQHSKGDAGEVVWQASREAMALKATLRKAKAPLPIHGVVVATRSSVPRGALDLGKVAFVETHRLGTFIRTVRQALTPEQVAGAVRALSD